jgi:release factor glutamine methyltransferase
LRQAEDTLTCCSDSPRLEAELLLCQILGRDRGFLYSHPEGLLGDAQIDEYRRLLDRRRCGEPLAYITGTKEFWSLPFKVTKDVLIPRPDTELVVELALECFSAEQAISAADLGTGCGAIGCAIAHDRPLWRVIATDRSEPALRIARYNVEALELGNIDLNCCRWFAPLQARQFEMIVSNPPYVRENDPHLDQPELRHEPRNALVSQDDGLADIRQIVTDAPYSLSDDGMLILEHGYDQGARVRQLLRDRGFKDVRSHFDLAAIERASVGRWKGSN